jgi:hypothetical protein
MSPISLSLSGTLDTGRPCYRHRRHPALLSQVTADFAEDVRKILYGTRGVAMSIQVIGTGFGRTGTDSMREALNVLGFGPCHHMYEVNNDETQKQRWRAVAKGASLDWEVLFEGYSSCVDWPSCYYWRELIEAYPQARVIHTDRSAESWWQSVERSFLSMSRADVDPDSLGEVLIAGKVFGGRMERAHAISVYEAHRRDVLATVPPDRLLVHAPGDGWEPLCRHLGVPFPDQPYPHRNSYEEFRSRIGSQH